MMTENFEERLTKLCTVGIKEAKHSSSWDLEDEVSGLSDTEKQSWARVLASIASSEAMESVLLGPLGRGVSFLPGVEAWLKTHSEDELRHLTIINRYLRNTFKFTKKKKSLTDVVIYERLLPLVAHLGEKKPLVILAILHFYEAFSVAFYKEFKDRAQHFELSRLVEIFRVIEKDELRHVAGVEAMIKALHHVRAKPSLVDSLLAGAALALVMADINTSRWAFYNRSVRKNVRAIGIDTKSMNRQALQSAKIAFKKVWGEM